MPIELTTVPCLADNYAYLCRDEATGKVALVDAPEVDPIVEKLDQLGWSLDTILITHHHADHVDAVDPLREKYHAHVVGSVRDEHRLPKLDRAVDEGDSVMIGQSVGIVFDVSGHTIGHVAFHFPDSKLAFTADSLMALGCGRLFEGSAQQMWQSLSKFHAFDPDTVICSGHEYTQSNARFCLTIEPNNVALQKRAEDIDAKRANGDATVPSRLRDELATNPFLRSHLPEVKTALGMVDADDVAVFTEIRRRKDSF